MSEPLLYFNGVNAGTGTYLVPPMPASALATIARGDAVNADTLADAKWRATQKQSHLGVKAGVDATDLAQAGWGVIFAQGENPAVRDALRELLDYRQAQANQSKERYREYWGDDGYLPGESKNAFLARHGVGPGAVDPDKVPYYLLLVGDPEKIPYSFQYQLDVAYAVGRIHFDTTAEYAQYAQSVVRAEKGLVARGKRAVFFSAANPDDPSTQASTQNLAQPLADKMRVSQTAWTFDSYLADGATKTRLEALLKDDAPAFLFTATHGAGFDYGEPRQVKHQGALICQDWSGPKAMANRPIPQSMYYAMDDVPGDARVHGMIAFHFACFGAGTPRYDEFAHLRQGVKTILEPMQLAPYAFVARLPRALLAHPKGGALAVIGHVDRAWGASFLWNSKIEQLSTFESMLTRLLDGYPIGAAMEFFNERYAELAASLSSDLENLKKPYIKVNLDEFSMLWTANNDARGYAVLGDPAVRIQSQARAPNAPVMESITLSAETSSPVAPNDALNTTASETSEQQIEATIAKLERQVADLNATIQALRAALQSKST
jgi:hypothetical protein